MTNEELTALILEKLNIEPLAIFKKARANSAEILAKNLVNAIISYNTVTKAAKALHSSEQTLNRVIYKHLVPILGNLQGGGETWKLHLLNLIKYKECTKCKQIKQLTNYYY
jgi:hypothetical protein